MASIKQNTIFNTLLTISNVLFPFITAPYISRVLGVENIGVVNFSVSYASYFVLFAALGVPRYGIRAIAGCGDDLERRNKTFSELFHIVSISSIFITLIYVISIFSVDQLYEQRLYLFISGFTVISASFNIEWYFSGRENFKLITIRSLIVKILSILGMFIIVKNENDVVPYMLLSTGAIVINQFWNWTYFFRKDNGKIVTRRLMYRPHIKPLFLLFASSISVSIYTMIDTLLLGFLSTYAQVGYYTQALKIVKLALPITISMAPVIFARISSMSKEENNTQQIKETLQKSFLYMFTIAVPLTIGLFITAPAFIPLFFGDAFQPSVILLQILCPIVFLVGVSNFHGIQIIQAMGYDKLFLYGILGGTVVSITLNSLLIGSLGAVGASIASVSAELTVTILMFLFSLKIIKVEYKFNELIVPVIASIPMIALNYTLGLFNLTYFEILAILIPFAVISYSAILLWFKNPPIIVIKNTIQSKLKLTK